MKRPLCNAVKRIFCRLKDYCPLLLRHLPRQIDRVAVTLRNAAARLSAKAPASPARNAPVTFKVRRYAHMSVKHLQPYADQLIFPVTEADSPKALENQKPAGHKSGHSGASPRLHLVVSN